VLYYDYDEDDNTHTKVTTSTSYTESKLSNITFVPADGYEGTVTISFTAYTEDDNSYSGKLVITVGDTESYTADTITYTTNKGDAVTFDGSDFADECENATDEDFSYLKFTSLPSSTYGVL
jgi:hypothetical protein